MRRVWLKDKNFVFHIKISYADEDRQQSWYYCSQIYHIMRYNGIKKCIKEFESPEDLKKYYMDLMLKHVREILNKKTKGK